MAWLLTIACLFPLVCAVAPAPMQQTRQMSYHFCSWYGTRGILPYHILALVLACARRASTWSMWLLTYIALNQATLIKMVERVDWKDAISGGSTLGLGGTGLPNCGSAPKFSHTVDTLWSIDYQKNSKVDITRCQILRQKCTKFNSRLPCWGSLQTP